MHIELVGPARGAAEARVEIVDPDTMLARQSVTIRDGVDLPLPGSAALLAVRASGFEPLHVWVVADGARRLEVRLQPIEGARESARVSAGEPQCGASAISVALADVTNAWTELGFVLARDHATSSHNASWTQYTHAEAQVDWGTRRAWIAQRRVDCDDAWPAELIALYFADFAPPESADCEITAAALALENAPVADQAALGWRAHASEAAKRCGLEVPTEWTDTPRPLSEEIARLRYARRKGRHDDARKIRDRIVADLGDAQLGSTWVNELLARYGPLARGLALPSVRLTDLDPQGPFDPSGPHERWQLVLLWAPWCPPCREHLPALNRLARERSDLDVLAISLADAAPTRDYLRKHDLNDVHAVWIPEPDRAEFKRAFQMWTTGVLLLVAPDGVIARADPDLRLEDAAERVVAAMGSPGG